MQQALNYTAVKTFVIDLFCGAGGTSTAIHKAGTNIEVIACINHDKNAIISHSANYPNCVHYTEDIRTVSLNNLKKLIEKLRVQHPGCKIALWASLECTHFSKAKGGQARNEDSRTLAEHLYRYDDILDLDFIWIENVREFMTWGPIDEEGKPIKDFKGCDYERWVKEFESRGYNYDWKLLNSADYGAYTARTRYFGQFSKDKSLIAWPEITHTKKGSDTTLKYKAVRDVLELDNEGESIFTRKKQLCNKTLERIYAGLIKFVANGNTSFLCSYYGNPTFNNGDDPCGTLTTKDTFQKINTVFIDNQYGNSKGTSADQPIGTITVNPKQNLISVNRKSQFLMNPQFSSKGSSVDNPCFTLIARMDKAPPYVIATDFGKGTEIVVYDTDPEPMIQIKKFMAAYGIIDIKMRMLEIVEMLQIQGFPKKYRLVGTKTEQKKYIGNSVEVTVGTCLFKIIDINIQKQLSYVK